MLLQLSKQLRHERFSGLTLYQANGKQKTDTLTKNRLPPSQNLAEPKISYKIQHHEILIGTKR